MLIPVDVPTQVQVADACSFNRDACKRGAQICMGSRRTDLLGFLQAGGHVLWRRYGRQAIKLFAVVQREWVPSLAKQGAAAAAEMTQLRLYCESGYRDEPEGAEIVQSVQDSEAADA